MLESAYRHQSNVQRTKQAQIARQRLPMKNTPYKTIYSNTFKMVEKRQRGLAEMWQVAALKTKKKKDVPEAHGRHLRAFMNFFTGYSILFSFYSKI